MRTILEFVYYLFDGGAETLVKQYCLMLDKREFCPIVLTIYPNYSSAVYKTLLKNNIKIYHIYPKRNSFFRLINKLFGKFYFPFRLRKIIREENVKAIHCHTAVLRYINYAKKTLDGIKLIYTCHSTPERYFFGKVKKEYIVASDLITNYNLQMVALHDNMKQEVDRLFNINNTVVIKNGIDLSRYRNIKVSRDYIRKSLSIPQNAFVLGHVGRFFEPKNHEFLSKIFIELKEVKKNAFLLMIGEGILREHIEKLLKENGFENDYLILSNRTDIPELLKAMDVFVFPSKVEGFGIALLEAQAVGLKCICSTEIPDAACVSNLVTKLSLNSDIKTWCKAILSDVPSNINLSLINDFDMRNEIKKLESLYR